MQKHHSISSYDKNLFLKPNLEMWLSLLFLLKPYLVLILSIVSLKNRDGLIEVFYTNRQSMAMGALAGVPVVFLVYALFKRKPGAPPLVRSIWRKGRMLMAISALLSAAAIFVPFWLKTVYKITPGDWVQFVIALLIVIVVYTSPYIRDCFNDFPSDEASGKSS